MLGYAKTHKHQMRARTAESRKVWRDEDLYELVETYFKILRKYGLHTKEEPYYFLSPKRKRNVKLTGDMLKRSTRIDENEINISILEDLVWIKSLKDA